MYVKVSKFQGVVENIGPLKGHYKLPVRNRNKRWKKYQDNNDNRYVALTPSRYQKANGTIKQENASW